MDWAVWGPIALGTGIVVVVASMVVGEVLRRRSGTALAEPLPAGPGWAGPPPAEPMAAPPPAAPPPEPSQQPPPPEPPAPEPPTPETLAPEPERVEADRVLSELDGEMDELAQRLRRLGGGDS